MSEILIQLLVNSLHFPPSLHSLISLHRQEFVLLHPRHVCLKVGELTIHFSSM